MGTSDKTANRADEDLSPGLRRVSAHQNGMRLDNAVRSLLGSHIPMSAVHRWIRRGIVRHNKKRAKSAARVATGDLVRVPYVETHNHAPAKPISLRILYEDDFCFAVEKPSGIASHADDRGIPGLYERLKAQPERSEIELVHRLDRGTSGCMMFAHQKTAARLLHEIFRKRLIEKTYLCLCDGDIEADTLSCNAPLVISSGAGSAKVRAVKHGDPDGVEARTHFKVLQRRGGTTLVEARPESGRTHQIRVHLAHLGYPIVGDYQYHPQGRTSEHADGRLSLHAWRLAWTPPGSEAKVTVETDLPEFAASLR